MIPRTQFPSELPHDRRIRKLSRLLGIHLDAALAIVVRLWCYCSRQLDGGDLVQHDAEDLAEAAGFGGNGVDLVGALLDSLLANKVEGGIVLALYHESNDAYITERNYNINRLKEWRARKREERDGNANPFANDDANPCSGLVLSGLVEEKKPARASARSSAGFPSGPPAASSSPRTSGAYREWVPPEDEVALKRSALKRSRGPLGAAKSESPPGQAIPARSPGGSAVPDESTRRVVGELQAMVARAEAEGDTATAQRLREGLRPYVDLLKAGA